MIIARGFWIPCDTLAFELKKPTLVLVLGEVLFTHHKWMWIRPTNKNCLSCHTRMVGQIDMVGVGNDQIMVTPSIYNHLKTKQQFLFLLAQENKLN